jgi:hypothetical protein
VELTDYFGVCLNRLGAPAFLIHWNTHALELGADGPIQYDDLAVVLPFP